MNQVNDDIHLNSADFGGDNVHTENFGWNNLYTNQVWKLADISWVLTRYPLVKFSPSWFPQKKT